MNSPAAAVVNVREVLQTLRRNAWTWLLPALAVTALAALYAGVKREYWEASQGVVIRNEATNNQEGPGRFRHFDDMKVSQETMLEIAKSRGVLAAALADVGPPEGGTPSAGWPSDDDVAELRFFLSISPPKGAEFGKTEVFYVKVKSTDRQRAVDLTQAVCRHLQSGLRSLREAKAQSMIDELTQGAKGAQQELERSTAKLAEMEEFLGADLGELRMLDMTANNDSDLRRKLVLVEAELRETRTARLFNQELLNLLHAAEKDPGRLLATPNRLLESQPALRKLKDGLIDAQMRTSQLLGGMQEQHPQVVAARAAEQGISDDLHRELNIAVRGVELELRLSSQRLESLVLEQRQVRERLDRLAGLRAEYSALASDVKHRTVLLEKSQHDLAEAQSSLAGANGAGLLSVIGRPEAGTRPQGPDAAVIVGAGGLGGVFIGWGLLFLTVVPAKSVDAAQQIAKVEERVAANLKPLEPYPAPRLAVLPSERSLSLNEALRRVGRRSPAKS